MYLYCLSDYIKPIATGTAWELIVQPICTGTVLWLFSSWRFLCSLWFHLVVGRIAELFWQRPAGRFRLKTSLRAYAVILFFTKLTKDRLTQYIFYLLFVTRIVRAGVILWEAAINMKIQIVQKCANSEDGIANFIKKEQGHCAAVLKNFNQIRITRLVSSISPVQLVLVTTFVLIDVCVLCSLFFLTVGV